nr:hypothetical protein [Tanacetum cinerariifolium]
MTEEEDDMGVAIRDGGEDVVESKDISILNSLIGHVSPRSLQLWGKIGKGDVHVLIDNGSTHNFIRPDVVEKMCLPIKSTKAFKVDLYELPMQGPNVLLGIQWLQNLDKVTHDYAHQTMEFTLLDTTYSLKGDDSLRMKKIRLHQIHAMLEHDDVYGVYEVPTTLPPHRSIDHRIHLLPETKPVNVRPYRYPYYQKEEMENLVNEILSQGIIRFSQSPFSSPVLLVKKKDGSYRFCVDYRALNAITVKDKFPIPTPDEMFNELGGAIIFTKLGLRAGYHQIRVHERDVYKTAFCTHDGHYEFLVMPFGLTNAPSTFQATMIRLFAPYLRKSVIVFYDILTKCVFGAETLEYLGHMISGRGVEIDPKKSENETLKELQALHQQLDTRSGPDGFRREQGLLIFRNHYYVGTESKLKALLLCEFHDTPSAGHGGVKKIYLQPLPTPEGVWEDVSMDYITGLPLSKGFITIWVVVDHFSKLPLSLIPYPPRASKVAVVEELLMERNEVTRQLKQNLLAAKLRMEEKVNHKRRDVEFKVGDKVFVMLQPYRQTTLVKRLSNKLAKRFYGSYEIVERVRKVAYRLALPVTSQSPEEATWKWLTDFKSAYPTCNLEDKVVSEDRWNVTPLVGRLGHGTRTKKAPKWQESFVTG